MGTFAAGLADAVKSC